MDATDDAFDFLRLCSGRIWGTVSERQQRKSSRKGVVEDIVFAAEYKSWHSQKKSKE